MKKWLSLFLTAVLTIGSLTGCTQIKNGIAYSVYPIGYLIERIAGTDFEKESIQTNEIIQRAQIAENYQEILEKSAVYMHIGNLEPYHTAYGKNILAASDDTMDLSALNAVYNFKRYTKVTADNMTTYIEAPYYSGEVFTTIDTDEKDLYLWNDPIAMYSMSKDILKWLCENYPDQTVQFNDNFEKLETDLINLDAMYQKLATALETDGQEIRFVSMTASFSSWQKTYGFQVYPLILSKYGVLPTEKQLELIKQRIIEDGVKYIIYEPNMTEDMIALFDEVQNELGLIRVELSNLSSLSESEEEAGKDYLSIMYENLSVLETMKESVSGIELNGNTGS